MTQTLNIKSILLEKLNRILNPNFEKKFVWTILISGISLLGYQRLLQLASELELISKDLHLKLSLTSGTDSIFIIIGGIMIIFSCIFFWLNHTKKDDSAIKKYKNLTHAARDLQEILDDNRRIFMTFGPNSDSGSTGHFRQDLEIWDASKRDQILPNNQKILQILKNIKNFSNSERPIVEKMKSHIEAFQKHCDNSNFDYSENQFPLGFFDLIMSYLKSSNVKITIYRDWFNEKVSHIKPSIESISIFGSALYGQESVDVDIIVKTLDKKVEDIKNTSLFFEQLKKDFSNSFELELHLKVFSDIEKETYKTFLKKLYKVERIL